MSKEEIIEKLKDRLDRTTFQVSALEQTHNYDTEMIDKLKGENVELHKELNDLKEKYKRLSIEAQATAFDDRNNDTECLLRVLLHQGEIELNKKGEYERKNFDWEDNLMKLGLMKKREKGFYIADDIDDYVRQLEFQLKEYNELKKIFKNYYVFENETMYDGCIKMQNEIDELKEENLKLKNELKKKLLEMD